MAVSKKPIIIELIFDTLYDEKTQTVAADRKLTHKCKRPTNTPCTDQASAHLSLLSTVAESQ